ncbi:hypothetical protein [Arthrobacter sp. efr-133-TYG-120]|uniref:hypothetical protein n=1 Tax=Arthrobacter sp. efr-133-TYG-120 TaxID=3040280 RepID=UPI00254F10D7|nr:hypothetical protein [Arthrobacter sp. efr-133-TYG-120]
MKRLKFWPYYGPGPLWSDKGQPVDLKSLGISSELVEQVRSWNSQYEEDRIPLNGPGDAEWLAEGVGLLRQLRTDLGDDFDLVVTSSGGAKRRILSRGFTARDSHPAWP